MRENTFLRQQGFVRLPLKFRDQVIRSDWMTMTIPVGAVRNYCPSCDETREVHTRICTVCGTELQYPRDTTTMSSRRNERSSVRSYSANLILPPELLVQQPPPTLGDIQQASQSVREMLLNIQQQIGVVREAQEDLLQELQRMRGVEEQFLLQPSQRSTSSRPTSQAFLHALPRTVVQEQSSLLYQSTITFNNLSFSAIPADFGTKTDLSLVNVPLVVASPSRTGHQPLSRVTRDVLRWKPSILYMDRGDTTFAHKALLAQHAGAAGLVIGNTVSTPWPYTMQDSTKTEATAITIPVVMLSKTDASILLKNHTATNNSTISQITTLTLHLSRRQDPCVICHELYECGAHVLALSCGHLFHEPCGLAWLNQHHTCPTCRLELPTDDAEFEATRRRTNRTHAGGSPTTTTTGSGSGGNADEFYG